MTDERVAAVVLLRADGAALLQHRDDLPGLSHAGKWTPPGGHCEPGESIEECARREFFEETGYRLVGLHWLTSFLDDNAPGVPPLWLTVFWASYDGAQRLVCREGQALRFIERSEVAAYPIPGYLVDIWDRAVAACHRAGDDRAHAAWQRSLAPDAPPGT